MSNHFDGHWLASSYRALAQAIKEEEGLTAVISTLGRVLEAPVGLFDTRGSVLASVPSRMDWNTEVILSMGRDHDTQSVENMVVVPLRLEGDVVALLCALIESDRGNLCEFAADLIATQLSKEQARSEGRRELAAQVLSDIFNAKVPEHDAATRLSHLGVNLELPHRVVIAQVKTSPRKLRSISWNLHTLLRSAGDAFLRVVIDNRLVMVVLATAPISALAQATHDHLARLGPDPRVGIGAAYPGVAGLRLSYFHARSALSRPGISEKMELSLTSILMLGTSTIPLQSLSSEALRPLLDYDKKHGGELLHTLAAYLRLDRSHQATADELYVHRNTLRYRLDQVEKLTGKSLSSFRDVMHFWIAIESLGIAADIASPSNELESLPSAITRMDFS